MGVMIHVWNECQERQTYTFTTEALDAIGARLSVKGLSVAILASELGAKRDNRIRIRGTRGRIEWLEDHRKSNRERQKRRRDRLREEKDASRVSHALHPRVSRGAPAPAPALSSPESSPLRSEDPSEDSESDSSALHEDVAAEPPVHVFTCVGRQGDSFAVTADMHAGWVRAFPSVDASAEYPRMEVWLKANGRKTLRGMPRFIVNWLGKAQDRARAAGTKPATVKVYGQEFPAEQPDFPEEPPNKLLPPDVVAKRLADFEARKAARRGNS